MADVGNVLSVIKTLSKALGAREAATGLRGLQLFKPVDYLAEAANRVGAAGPESAFVVAAPEQINQLGRWYASAPEIDMSPETKAVYRMMADETGKQFDLLTRPVSRGGLGVDVSIADTDPYDVRTKEGVAQLVDDLQNRKLAALSTKTTGGHPFFTNDENDQFRLVHDAFGHGATGRGFNSHGEEAAYRAHAMMYPEEARRAVASETRAQNAFVNLFGNFSDQKLVLLPEEMAALNAYELPEDVRRTIVLNALMRMTK